MALSYTASTSFHLAMNTTVAVVPEESNLGKEAWLAPKPHAKFDTVPLSELSDMEKTTKEKRVKPSFKALSADIVCQISVISELRRRSLARKRRDIVEDALRSLAQDKRPQKKKMCRAPSTDNLPAWYKSLYQKQQRREKSASLSPSASFVNFHRQSSSISSTCSNLDIEQYMKNLCLGSDEEVMCKRHALRALWKLYFFAFPRKIANIKDHASPATLDTPLLLRMLHEDAELFQPSGLAHGKREVINEFSAFEGVQTFADYTVQLVHNYVDEEASVTFSEYVLEFDSGKYIKVCEVMQWDLSAYETTVAVSAAGDKAGADDGRNSNSNTPSGAIIEGDKAYKKAIFKGSFPAIKKVMLFGKGFTELAARDLPIQMETSWQHKLSQGKFIEVVKDYVESFMGNQYENIYSMLCPCFRINAFDGVKTRDGFISCLSDLKSISIQGSFERKLEHVFVDHKSKTAFLQFYARCGGSTALVVNVVQWDLSGESIINIREYGTAFKLLH